MATQYLHPTQGWVGSATARNTITLMAEMAESQPAAQIDSEYLRENWRRIASRPTLWERHFNALNWGP
jgi:hypothetical protein